MPDINLFPAPILTASDHIFKGPKGNDFLPHSISFSIACKLISIFIILHYYNAIIYKQ